MVVVERVVQMGSRLIGQHERALMGRDRALGLEIDCRPVAILAIHQGTRDRIALGLDIEAAGDIDEEHLARALVRDLELHGTYWRLGYLQRLRIGVETDVLLDPVGDLHRIGTELLDRLAVKIVLEEALEGRDQHLVLHARTDLVALVGEAVLQDLRQDVAQVLVAQGIEDIQGTRLVVAMSVEESLNGTPVALRTKEIGSILRRAVLRIMRATDGLMAYLVLGSKARLVGRSLLGRHLGHVGRLLGRHNRHIHTRDRIIVAVEGDRHLAVLAKGHLLVAILSVLGSPDDHVAQTSRQEGGTLHIRIFRHGREELGIVVDLEIHTGVGHRIALSVHHLEVGPAHLGIIADEVDLRIVGRAQHGLLRSVIVAKGTGVHQQGP